MSNVIRSAEIDGVIVPLADCDWVLWTSCGCPAGVTVAVSGTEVKLTEDSALRAFCRTKRERDKAQRDGEHLELMTHQRWCDEVAERMKVRCTHGEVAA